MLALFLTLTLTASPQARPATNSVCPVCASEVYRDSRTTAVGSQNYRLCCGECGKSLAKQPETYLEKDGTPRNARGESFVFPLDNVS